MKGEHISTIFIDISKETQRERLEKRWDDEENIKKRALDFNWITPTINCTIIDWTSDSSLLADFIDDKF